MNEEEQAAMNDLLALMAKVQAWGLKANGAEMTQAIHVCQGFVIQHMLHRLEPDLWSSTGGTE